MFTFRKSTAKYPYTPLFCPLLVACSPVLFTQTTEHTNLWKSYQKCFPAFNMFFIIKVSWTLHVFKVFNLKGHFLIFKTHKSTKKCNENSAPRYITQQPLSHQPLIWIRQRILWFTYEVRKTADGTELPRTSFVTAQTYLAWNIKYSYS